MIWLAVLVICGPMLAYVLLLYAQRRKYAGVPGPPLSSFIMGNLSQINQARKRGLTLEELICEWHLQYGYVYVFFVLNQSLVCCIDPEIVKLMLLQHPRTYSKANYYDTIGFIFGERVVGYGLETERNYEKWAQQRTVLNAAFRRRFLSELVSDFNRLGDELVNAVHPLANSGQFFDISKHFRNATQDILSQVAFGVASGSLRGQSGLPEAVHGLLAGFEAANRSVLPTAWSPFVRKERSDLKRNVRTVKAAAAAVIKSRLEKMKRNESVSDDILSVMLSAHVKDPSFSMDLIFDNIFTFYIAGQETSANTLSFMFMELGKYPDILAKMRKEVDDHIGDKELISYDDICALKYINMVIKETLRMYPVAPGTLREPPEPVTYGNYSLPAGATIKFSPFSSGRHPDFFPDPLKFDPQRFDSRNGDRIAPTTYYPFSLGPRSCIGQNFAMIELKILIAKLLQRYGCAMDKSQSFALVGTANLSPAHGVWVVLNERRWYFINNQE